MRKLLALLLLLPLLAQAGTINGKIQTASGGTVANGTLTFSLNQVAYLPTAQVVAQQVPCYTDNFGNIVGEPDQTIAPSASVNLGSGTLAAGTYFVKTAIQDASGVSNVSPEASFTLSAPGTLIITAPGVQPANASGFRIYIGTASGNETLQGTVTGTPGTWANFSQSAALSAGSAMPVANTTVCTFAFTDSLNPSTTYYTINLVNSLGSKIAGYPISQARFYGGTNGSVNVSSGWPVSIGGVIWPSPIVSTPNSSATQSIAGGLSLGTFPLTAGAATFTSEINPNVNGIRFANAFPGTGATQINNAENDCGTNSCVVFIPSTVAAGAGQGLLVKDNVFVMDARSPASNAETQNSSLLFNIKDTALSGVRTKMFLVDPVQPASVMQPGNTSSTWYVHTFAEGNIAGFGTIEATNGTITVDTGTTGSPTAAVGVEAECFVSGTVANTITSCRGGTYNVGLTGAGSITNGVAIQAQAAVKSGSGAITNAVGLLAENQTVGSTNNLGIWDQGQSAFDKPMSIGNLGNGTSPQAGTMLFVRPLNGDLSGTVQAGIQAAPVTSSAATAIGVGVRARADTFAAAFAQALNQGVRVDTPTVGAASSIGEWDGVDIESAPTAGTKCSIKMAGSTSGTTCINTPSVTGGSMTILPINNGTVAKVFVASDFTTANNTSLQTITGLSFVFPAVAGNYNFHCALSYSQATAAVSDTFGIQAATNNPTNIFANGAVYTAAGVSTSGTLATLATTSATNIVTFTPGATATNNVAYLDGTLELAASANTINIMVSTSAGADAVTVKRGSYCSLY